MAIYKNEKQMLFHFLNNYIDYSKDWETIKYGMGYDLGDWNFTQIDNATIYRIARQIWIELNPLGNKLTNE